LDFGELTRGSLFIPSFPGLTGLTSACDQFDRCKALMGFVSGELPNSCVFRLWCYWLVLGMFQGVLLSFVGVLRPFSWSFGGDFVPRPRGVTEAS
jgi:hypothetical protein